MCNRCADVFFTSNISAEGLIRLFLKMCFYCDGKTGVKLHSGEPGSNYFVQPSLISPLIKITKSTIIDANTPYSGFRSTTCTHIESMKINGFLDIADCDIIDGDGSVSIPISTGKRIKENFVGSHLINYDSIIIINHFKGHRFAGFGGVIKDMSIGLASKKGKCWIHTAGQSVENVYYPTEQNAFIESMADAARSVQLLKKPMVFISFVNNLSVDGDSCPNARIPEINDKGIFASYDPVALDQACLDIVLQDACRNKIDSALVKRIQEMNGRYIISAAKQMNVGSSNYRLICID